MDFFTNKAPESIKGSEVAIYRVIDAKRFFMQKDVKRYKDSLLSHSKLPTNLKDLVYGQLLENYIAFCQHLPLSAEAKNQLFYETGFKRALATVKYFEQMIRQNNGYGHEEERLIFAFASAAMLFGIGRILENHTVEQVSADGKYINTWFPTIEMLNSGFYKLRVTSVKSEAYIEQMHVAYAHRVLPPQALAWLMEDQQLYVMWVKALSNFKEGFDVLDINVEMQDEKSLQEVFDLSVEKEMLKPNELDEAEKFWAWLKKIAAEKDQVDGIMVTQEGILCDIDKLVDQYGHETKLREVQKSHLRQGVAALGVGGVSGSMLLIDKESGYLETHGSVVSATQSQSHLGAPERFFSRVSGIAMQFMQAYVPPSR